MAPILPSSLPSASMGAMAHPPMMNAVNLSQGGNSSLVASHGTGNTVGAPLPPHVEAFYTAAPETPSFNNHAIPPSPLDTSNMFDDASKFLNQGAGPSSAVNLLKAQAEVIQVTLGWSVIGQLASKAASGLQTFLNNQV